MLVFSRHNAINAARMAASGALKSGTAGTSFVCSPKDEKIGRFENRAVAIRIAAFVPKSVSPTNVLGGFVFAEE